MYFHLKNTMHKLLCTGYVLAIRNPHDLLKSFLVVDILTCPSRKSTGVTDGINNGSLIVPVNQASETASRALELANLNEYSYDECY